MQPVGAGDPRCAQVSEDPFVNHRDPATHADGV